MKKYVLYCDRCAQEGKETVAVTMVWIRTAGISHALRFDVCAEHLAVIVGSAPSTNGASAPTPGTMPDMGPRAKLDNARLKKILAYMETHPRLTIGDVTRACGLDDTRAGGASRVIRHLERHGKLQRVVMGVYQTPGHTVPTPSLADGVELAAKLVKKEPGIRTAFLAPLLGMEAKQWKQTLPLLREKGVKTKGTKSAMRLYPPKA